MWPSGNGDQLVYENGGYIYKLSLQSGEPEKIKVSISFDNPNLVPYYKDVKDDIHSGAVSPTGKRALFDARGDIFSVPAEKGITETSPKPRESARYSLHGRPTGNISHTTPIRQASTSYGSLKTKKEHSHGR